MRSQLPDTQLPDIFAIMLPGIAPWCKRSCRTIPAAAATAMQEHFTGIERRWRCWGRTSRAVGQSDSRGVESGE